jgi:hypothetical protein
MKNYTTKKFTLATILMLATPVAIVAPLLSTQTINAQSTGTLYNVGKINEIFCLSEGYLIEGAQKMEAFKSPADKRPYIDHVIDFEQWYRAAHRDVVVAMDTLLESVPKDSVDYKPVLQTHVVLHKMVHIMDFIQKSLRANQGVTSAATLATKLQAMNATARGKLQDIFVSLGALAEIMKATPGYEELAFKITTIQLELRELLKDDNMSVAQKFKMLGVLKQRCKQ